MVNDRVNCSEVYYFLDIQLPYNLTTFSVRLKFPHKNHFTC